MMNTTRCIQSAVATASNDGQAKIHCKKMAAKNYSSWNACTLNYILVDMPTHCTHGTRALIILPRTRRGVHHASRVPPTPRCLAHARLIRPHGLSPGLVRRTCKTAHSSVRVRTNSDKCSLRSGQRRADARGLAEF